VLTSPVVSLALSLCRGEDGTVTTWRDGNKVQSIAMPCNSVWAVASRANGDLLVACNDGMGRVFSRDPSRQAPDDVIASFIEHVAQVALARYHPPTCIHNAHKLVYSCLSIYPQAPVRLVCLFVVRVCVDRVVGLGKPRKRSVTSTRRTWLVSSV